jgi:class 3 adenylate cyclase
MTNLRTAVIMKTDIGGSTPRFRALLEADLQALLTEHRKFLSRHAATHGGQIVKPEGDGFWLVFPSVTAAAMAAIGMQEELQLAQLNTGDERLAMRIVITLGDVLHEEGALIGDTVVLTARIEAIAPLDEIYLSAPARLAVNQAEIRTTFVNTFPLKGFAEPVPIYRVERTHRTQVIANEYIVLTDLVGFGRLNQSTTTVEKLLDGLFELVKRVTREFGCTVRFTAGDTCCLTFADPTSAMSAVELLSDSWGAFVRQTALGCMINIAVHQGTLYAYRSYFYGPGIDVAATLERESRRVLSPDDGAIFVTGEVRKSLRGTQWYSRLQALEIGSRSPKLAAIDVFRLEKAEVGNT